MAGIDFFGSTLTGGASAPAPAAPAPAAPAPAAPASASAPASAAPSAPAAPAERAQVVGGGLYFPLPKPPLASFRTGGRSFGAGRSRGRLHGGVDLLAAVGTPIRAIADGVVIQAPYFFYLGTNALEVNHPGIGVVRYGEISIAKPVRLKAGEHVQAGQIIAYVGRLDTGASMIHFELYSGKATGPLTERGRPPYQRRRDLLNPSDLIDRLSRASFGR